jgi:hypothetical protein
VGDIIQDEHEVKSYSLDLTTGESTCVDVRVYKMRVIDMHDDPIVAVRIAVPKTGKVDEDYLVDYTHKGHYWCTCKDFEHRHAHAMTKCKHIVRAADLIAAVMR